MKENQLFLDILSSQSAKKTQKQQRIVEAAIHLFAEKGYSNTSTSEIAKAAKVSEASIFKQYGTKINLLLSLIVPYLIEFFPSLAHKTMDQFTNLTELNFEEFLRELIKSRITFIMGNKEIFQILIKEIIYKENLKIELLPYFVRTVSPRMTSFIEHYKNQGELANIPSDRILKHLFTFIGGFIISRVVLLNMEPIHDEEIEDAIHFMMNGFRKSSSDK